jgi:hypothetical protein
LAWPDRFRKRRSCSLPFLLAAVVGYWVLVLAGAFSGAELAVSELGSLAVTPDTCAWFQ